MATEILMPQMGESIAEGTLTRWLVKVGDTVERDQPLLEISTDKVDMEIPSPAAGVVLDIQRQEGETVPVNEVVGLVGKAGETAASAASAESAVSAESATPAASSATAAAAGDAEGTAGADVAAAESSGADEAEGAETLEQRLRRHSSPLVRRIAKDEGVDLTQLEGTGIHGRVTKKDILAFVELRASDPAAAAAATSSQAALATAPAGAAAPATATPAARPTSGFSVPAFHAGENVVVEPMGRIRQLTADHMVYSKATSVHVTTVFHVDMSRVARLRRQGKDAFARENGTKLTYMPFIFRAVCDALKKFPQLNAAIDGSNIVYKKDINLGMAVALPGGGLIVPVIKKADEKNLVGLARSANDLADRARVRKLQPDEAAGGTFTITNPGVFGSLFGTPIINQPQVAILGVGTIEKRAVVLTDDDGNDALAIRTMSYFALTFDHRLIDGADADHFMNAIKATLQDSGWSELDPYI